MAKPKQMTLFESLGQPEYVLTEALSKAIDDASRSGVEARGAVFTRTEVVEFILDLAGYSADNGIEGKRVLEPSFGGGDFLMPIIDRLLGAWQARHGILDDAADGLRDAVRAVELHQDTFHATRGMVREQLIERGLAESAAAELVNEWLVAGDFLLEHVGGEFDFAVGNPPYVRQENIPAPLIEAYRRRYATIYDRADLYIPFIERSLSLLRERGVLGFICADRWTRNRYGGRLRAYIADGFHLRTYVDMTGCAAFKAEVSAYPAIIVVGRDDDGSCTRIARRPSIDRQSLQILSMKLKNQVPAEPNDSFCEVPDIVNGSQPWLLDSPKQVKLMRRLENAFPTLEQAGCRVGIGVATGADKAFIGDYETLDVERDRKLPLVTTRDIRSGEVCWEGLGVVNPFLEDGRLAPLDEYPRFAAYLEERRDIIAGRHCARKAPANWYRTIDRIQPSLAGTPKLLIPDIKGNAHIVYEDGKRYPHHNLYYITSNTWELRALQAVLLSSVARLFISMYSTRMRGGYLRFQAQYLRRIRIPEWESVPISIRKKLAEAGKERDLDKCNSCAAVLFGLSNDDCSILNEIEPV